MTTQEMLKHIDHTQLKAFAAWEDIVRLCDEAVELGINAVNQRGIVCFHLRFA